MKIYQGQNIPTTIYINTNFISTYLWIVTINFQQRLKRNPSFDIQIMHPYFDNFDFFLYVLNWWLDLQHNVSVDYCSVIKHYYQH